MKIVDKKISDIIDNNKLNLNFTNTKHTDLNLNCNILKNNFYLDSHNFFPITEDFISFSQIFKWGDVSKYKNFYSNNFIKNFKKNFKNFKRISNVFVLGSSSNDNYYRNIHTFLPRLFFIKDKKIKLALHRNSSNKIKNFIKILCNQMNITVQFVFLDDDFYFFLNSQIPQFLDRPKNIRILNSLNFGIKKKERIYINRQNCNFRNLINESDIIDKLKPLGFRIIDLSRLEIMEQIKLFNNAEIIIGSTGSGLANIVFCSPGTKIYEISPKYNSNLENIFKLRYESIAKFLNLNYFRIDADSIDIKKYDQKILDKINLNIIQSSNYYKNMILKIEKIDQLKLH